MFKPSKGGFKGCGAFSFTVLGLMVPIDKEIVMKFTKLERKSYAEEEFEYYSYLNAINKPEVEQFGIPAVYYYGVCEGFDLVMMGLTILDKDLDDLVKSKRFLENDINVLIVLRDFVS